MSKLASVQAGGQFRPPRLYSRFAALSKQEAE
jgi:hypothetical protein